MTAPEPACTAENPCAACQRDARKARDMMNVAALCCPNKPDPDQEDIDMDDELVSGGKCGGTPEETTAAAVVFGWAVFGIVCFLAGAAVYSLVVNP